VTVSPQFFEDPNLVGDVHPPQRNRIFGFLEALLRQLVFVFCRHVE
jgi:hypothetical protein